LKYFCEDFDDEYIIETRFITDNDTETDEYLAELAMLQSLDSDFNPEIELFATYGI
jgi:predicted ATP-dependent endonuclease of OLD family